MVTGGAGFIGSNFIRYWISKNPDDNVLNYDKLTYAGNLASVIDLRAYGRYHFIQGDICDEKFLQKNLEVYEIDLIVNFAAESHNSLAIHAPKQFFQSNLMGVVTILDVIRRMTKPPRFHHVSTCEVFGDLPLTGKSKFKESSPLRPNQPYSASKACAELAIQSFFKTYKLPITMSNACNNYGPWQMPEKLIPKFVTDLMEDKNITLYQESGAKREWMHVMDHCRGITRVINKGKIGHSYNIGSGLEKSIEEIANIILQEMKQPQSKKTYIKSRPSHDRRYLLDSSKIKQKLGFVPKIDFGEGLKATIKWYRNNEKWWRQAKQKLIVEEKWD